MSMWTYETGMPLLDATFPLPVDAPFTLTQATAAGLTRHTLRTLTARGLVRRLVKGVYVAAQVPDSRLLRTRALQLVAPRGCVVTDWTACWLWTGLLAPNEHLAEPVPSIYRAAGDGRLRNGLCRSGQRTFLREDLVDLDELTLTTPLRTAWDLGRLAHRDSAIGALDILERVAGVDHASLLGGVERFKGERDVVQLRQLAPLADPRSESPSESTLRLRWWDLSDLPRPRPQVSIAVGGSELYRVDLGVEDLQYGCEYDGEAFHDDSARDVRRRQDLLGRFGWDVEGVRRENVYGTGRDVERILYEGIARARRTISARRRHL